jgi:uncharacterized membrane protein YtjA (UPF0391 family)
LEVEVHQYQRERDFNELDTGMNWTLAFIIVAILAAVFVFTGLAGTAVGIAKFIGFLFAALFLLSLLTGFGRRA